MWSPTGLRARPQTFMLYRVTMTALKLHLPFGLWKAPGLPAAKISALPPKGNRSIPGFRLFRCSDIFLSRSAIAVFRDCLYA